MSERLTTTINHFKDGLTSMGTAAARHSIESWKAELETYDGAIFHTIATDLGHLHTELAKSEIDGEKVGKLLIKLGKETAKSGTHAGDKSGKVDELGSLLEKAGSQLSGATAKA